jgi:hypothetical protein
MQVEKVEKLWPPPFVHSRNDERGTADTVVQPQAHALLLL